MPTLSTLAIFVVSAVTLIVIPGPSVLYIVARSIHQGRRAGVVSAMGVEVGSLVHVTAAAIGISAILVSSAVAFSIVKFAGAAYLIYLGIRTLLTRENHRAALAVEPMRLRRVFAQGVIVNVLNPKVALFFFAFLPQFIDPARGNVAVQTLVLGALFVPIGFVIDSSYVLTAGVIGGWLRGNVRFPRAQRFVTGGVYLGLGVTTALTGSGKK